MSRESLAELRHRLNYHCKVRTRQLDGGAILCRRCLKWVNQEDMEGIQT